MEPLISREMYGPQLSLAIERMGRTAVSIANRWQLGWPDRVQALLNDCSYLLNLHAQKTRELDVLSEVSDLRHLSDREILVLHGISEAPPVIEHKVINEVTFVEGTALSCIPPIFMYAGPPQTVSWEGLRAQISIEEEWERIERDRLQLSP